MIKPLKDQVLVKPTEVENKTSGGLFIPNATVDGPVKGTVVAVGDNENMTVTVGDTVLYVKDSGIKTTNDDEELLFLKEETILAIVE